MNVFETTSILLTGSALGSFINYKWIKLPSSIGLLILTMAFSLIVIVLNKIGLIGNSIELFLSNINFQKIVFQGMLSFLLFAGALQVNIEDLKKTKALIAITATISTLISTLVIGLTFYFLAYLLGYESITLLSAMLFGAIVSPTDPITVLAITKKIRALKKIETTIIGESLFNDGVAIVLFLIILELINKPGTTDTSSVIGFVLYEIGGGILFGGLIGWIGYKMLSRIDSFQVELLITLAIATGGYTLAGRLDFSAPLTMVIAGIIIGCKTNIQDRTDQTRKYIDSFWEVIDEILNAVLFLLIGLEMMAIQVSFTMIVLGLSCILMALIARFISVAIPLSLLDPFYSSNRGTIVILTWGGLRGALSIAMVLSLSQQTLKEVFLPCIYFIVIFSIAVQGVTLGKVLKKYKMESHKR